MKRKFSSGFQLWAALYAVLTVVSAIAQLINGAGTDTNINALARALACLAPIVAYYLFDFGAPRKRIKRLLMLILHYVICRHAPGCSSIWRAFAEKRRRRLLGSARQFHHRLRGDRGHHRHHRGAEEYE